MQMERPEVAIILILSNHVVTYQYLLFKQINNIFKSHKTFKNSLFQN